jgi:DNA primase
VFTFLQKTEGLEFGEVLQMLAARAGVTLTSYKPTHVEEQKEKLLKINSLASDYYHYLLTTHELGKQARDYVQSRGITDESVEKFKLGYAPAGWDYLRQFLVEKKKFSLLDVQLSGLVIENKNYDRFRNRLMFPLNNYRGQVVGFAGRVLPGADEKAGGKYVNTPETDIYHKSELLYGLDLTRSDIKQAKFAVIVEGEIDAIASWQAGIKNVVAIKGSALTVRQVELLHRLIDTIVLSLNTNLAGDAASRRGIEIAEKAGLIIKVVVIKGAKDPGELAISNPDKWKEYVAQAIPIYDFYLQSATERYGLEAEGKKKISRELLPIWNNIDDEIEKASYIQKLAAVLGVGEADVRAQMAKTSTGVKVQEEKPVVIIESKSKRELLEEYIVGLCLRTDHWNELPRLQKIIKTDFWSKVLDLLGKNHNTGDLPPQFQTRVQELYLIEEDASDKEWDKAIARLEELDIREQIAAATDSEQLRQLSARLGELTREQ